MCNFTITFTGTADSFINKIKTRIEDANGAFNGDTVKGSFSVPTPLGKVAGSYMINGQDADIVISKNPLL